MKSDSTIIGAKKASYKIDLGNKEIQCPVCQSDKVFLLFLSNLSDATFILDKAGCVEFANKAAEKIFGWRIGEFIGRNLHSLVHHSGREGQALPYSDCPISHLAEMDNQNFSGEQICWTKNGSRILVRIVAFAIMGNCIQDGAIVLFSDISQSRRLKDELVSTHAKMVSEQLALRQKDTALKEILKQIDNEKSLLKFHIQSNIDKIAGPIINKLSERLSGTDTEYLDMLRNCLSDIASPFVGQLYSKESKLTPREIEVCNMIKNGMSSKDIAQMLNISEQTVHQRRKLIRRKLDLTNKKINLTTHLQNYPCE